MSMTALWLKRSRYEETNEKKPGKYPPCSEGSEEFLSDVSGGKFGLDVPQRILLDFPDPKLSTCQH